MLSSTIKMTAVTMLAALALACDAPAPTVVSHTSNSPAPVRPGAGAANDLKLQAPEGWVSEQPSSGMRVAQYRLPGEAGDANLAVFYFGPGQGGSVEANFDRWVGQMQQPDGSPSKEKAKIETTSVNGMKVTLLDVTGTYSAGDMGGGAAAQQSKPDSRMRAGVIETPKGAYYIKLVGPEKTVSRWDDSFMAFIKSAQMK
jgi:hypothetical protein